MRLESKSKVKPSLKVIESIKQPRKPQEFKLSDGSEKIREITDLKVDYLRNEIKTIKKLKQFLQQVNTLTKCLIEPRKKQPAFIDKDKQTLVKQKKKNSFRLDSFKQCTKATVQPQCESNLSQVLEEQFKTKIQNLYSILKTKNFQLSENIKQVRQMISNSSSHEETLFYVLTESNYEQKMMALQLKLEASENNLQEKQKEKRQNSIFQKNIKSNNVRMSYRSWTNQFKAVHNFIGIKNKVKSEIMAINKLYKILRAQSLNQNKNTSNTANDTYTDKKQKESSRKQFICPLLISSKNIVASLKLLQNKYIAPSHVEIFSRPDNSFPPFIHIFIQQLNKQILFSELQKTKQKISNLKYKTQEIENKIKDMEAFKALIILKHKKYGNENDQKLNVKLSFNEEILFWILQHQFLDRKLSFRFDIKFSDLKVTKSLSKDDIQFFQSSPSWKNLKLRKHQSLPTKFQLTYLSKLNQQSLKSQSKVNFSSINKVEKQEDTRLSSLSTNH